MNCCVWWQILRANLPAPTTFARTADAPGASLRKTDKPGIDIRVAPGTKGEKVYIPACVTHSGVDDLVYNDFYIGEGADVVVVDDDAQPLVLCECKAPEIPIDRHVLAQAVRYNSVLGARYLVLTNGRSHYCYELVEGEYRQCDRFPSIGSGMGD